MKFFTDQHDSVPQTIVKIGTSNLTFLVQQMSASIITHLKEKNFNYVLKEYCDFAEHGYENSLLTMVKFLYNFMEIYKDNWYIKNSINRKLLCDAITMFKQFKDKKQEELEKECGEGFGSETYYYKWNPAEYVKYWI